MEKVKFYSSSHLDISFVFAFQLRHWAKFICLKKNYGLFSNIFIDFSSFIQLNLKLKYKKNKDLFSITHMTF